MVGDGGIRAIADVLTLANADMAIVPGRTISKNKSVAPLFPEEFHILAREEISSIRDLEGKAESFGEDGSAGRSLAAKYLPISGSA